MLTIFAKNSSEDVRLGSNYAILHDFEDIYLRIFQIWQFTKSFCFTKKLNALGIMF